MPKETTSEIAFKKGASAGESGASFYSNPYNPIDEEELFDAWGDGWLEAVMNRKKTDAA